MREGVPGEGPTVASRPREPRARPAPALPFPIECYDLPHPGVPPALEGFRILHIADPHQRGPLRRRSPIGRLLAALPGLEVDLVVLTGDYQDHPGDEPHAVEALEALAGAWRSRHGAIGIWGNHDTEALRALAPASDGIAWLEAGVVALAGLPMRVLGASYPEDCLAAARRAGPAAVFTLALLHYPTEVYAAANLGAHLALAGHTHGGQVRLHAGLAPHTSCDLPHDAASGVLRLRDTLCATSRGLGTTLLPLRLRCPAQAPIYTLRRAPLPGAPCEVATPVVRW